MSEVWRPLPGRRHRGAPRLPGAGAGRRRLPDWDPRPRPRDHRGRGGLCPGPGQLLLPVQRVRGEPGLLRHRQLQVRHDDH